MVLETDTNKMMKPEDTGNKLQKKQRKQTYRAYCPIIDMVVEAESKEDRIAKTQKLIKKKEKKAE